MCGVKALIQVAGSTCLHSCAIFLIEGVGISRENASPSVRRKGLLYLDWSVLEVYPYCIHHAGVDGLLLLFLFTSFRVLRHHCLGVSTTWALPDRLLTVKQYEGLPIEPVTLRKHFECCLTLLEESSNKE